ncbi:hypothetical protein LQE85_15350 [Stenotrophomonas rhizophila]|uniref:hypothetical protein n=1 Tax=Stenotrophomonas TaxID=40323 RepID=UPI00201D2C4A|nr:hypothetical protein [Stenotrophomonas rhizophila]UQY86846.1 hypothetical protein LQE85_15350 [Stenotrophomonas rhizophila]
MPNINTKIHTLAQALWNKRNNVSLSSKTRLKLTEIANAEFGGSAKHVFNGKAGGVARFDGDGAGLRTAIVGGLMNVRSPVLRKTMNQWLERLPAPGPHPGNRFELKVTQRFATAPDRMSIVRTWLATSPIGGAAQRQELPAVEIPREDYQTTRIPAAGIPEPDYDDAQVPILPEEDDHEPFRPEPEARQSRGAQDGPCVRFNDTVHVVPAAPVDETEMSSAPEPSQLREASKSKHDILLSQFLEEIAQSREEGRPQGDFTPEELETFANAALRSNAVSRRAKAKIRDIVATTAAVPTATRLERLITR